MGAGEHSGRVDSCFQSTQTLKGRSVVEPVTSPAGALVEVGAMDAGCPEEEYLLNQLYMGVDLRSRGRIRGNSYCKHQKPGLQVTDGAGIRRSLGDGTAEMPQLHRQQRRSRSVTRTGDKRVDRRRR
jgi:hypothetical protein